ncbi:MAG: hypothetical protein QJR12_00115 [Mycobacterium sp.]|uniref:hypothetical protein n=1 Tax=Mycobacterium sp. TaxID=1785 RepID=UPI00263066ED|nr:hypothetical protein [Mycobacterium sp.]MDI3312729.1 hypothetical protein [Mycobacterium sp.]
MPALLAFDPAELRWRASRCEALAAEVGSCGESPSGQLPTGQASAAAAHTARLAAYHATTAMADWLRAAASGVSGYTDRMLANEALSAAKLRAVDPKAG